MRFQPAGLLPLYSLSYTGGLSGKSNTNHPLSSLCTRVLTMSFRVRVWRQASTVSWQQKSGHCGRSDRPQARNALSALELHAYRGPCSVQPLLQEVAPLVSGYLDTASAWKKAAASEDQFRGRKMASFQATHTGKQYKVPVALSTFGPPKMNRKWFLKARQLCNYLRRQSGAAVAHLF